MTAPSDPDAAWSASTESSQARPALFASTGEQDGFVQERRKAARAMESKARSVEDARGAVRIAELQLEAARRTSNAPIRVARAEEAVEKARRQLSGAMDALSDAEADLAEVDRAVVAALSAAIMPDTPQLYYRSLPEFVEEFISKQYRRELVGKSQGLRWNPRWWESAEAITRLDALWRAFELLRLDGGTGMSVWMRDHLDYHMGVLMSENGPFSDARATAKLSDPLPVESPPQGQFKVW